MKKIYLFIAICFFSFSTLKAQNEGYKSTVCLNAGFSLVGNLIGASNYTSTDVSSYSIPAFQLTYDYSLKKWLSIGGAVSYQLMGLNYENWNGEAGNDFKTSIGRLNVAARFLFHYGDLGNIDMYSGLRVGATSWSVKTGIDDPDYDVDKDISFSKGTNFAPQVILFGLRGYFTENIGANIELCIGAPHYVSLGLNYRF